MKRSHTAILAAASLWGLMGLFSRTFTSYGFTTQQTASFRLTSAAVILIIIAAVKFRDKMRVSLRDIPLLALMGIISVFGLTTVYFKAIQLTGLASAGVLLYTAPFFVTAASAVLFKEKMTAKKLIALIVAFAGCALVSGSDIKLNAWGLVFGLLSGITYASYSIFGKVLLKKYESFTVTVWAFGFAGAASLLSINVSDTAAKLADCGIGVILLVLATGIVTAVLPYLLYTYGLERTDAGLASVMATLEPLVAALAGALVYKEIPSLLGVLGIILIIVAISMLSEIKLNIFNQRRKDYEKNS